MTPSHRLLATKDISYMTGKGCFEVWDSNGAKLKVQPQALERNHWTQMSCVVNCKSAEAFLKEMFTLNPPVSVRMKLLVSVSAFVPKGAFKSNEGDFLIFVLIFQLNIYK